MYNEVNCLVSSCMVLPLVEFYIDHETNISNFAVTPD